MEVLQHDQFINRIYGSQKNRKFLRLYNPASTSIDTEELLGRYRGLPNPHEGNISTSVEYCNYLKDFGEHCKYTTYTKPESLALC